MCRGVSPILEAALASAEAWAKEESAVNAPDRGTKVGRRAARVRWTRGRLIALH